MDSRSSETRGEGVQNRRETSGDLPEGRLSEIKAEVQADAWLHSDPRRRLTDVKAELRFDYSIFKERRRKDRKYLLAGGISNAQINSYFNRLKVRTEEFFSNECKLPNNPSVYPATFFFGSGSKKAQNSF